MKSHWNSSSRVLPALVFLLLGCSFVNCAGLQTDEVLFAAPLFRRWCLFSIPLGRYNIPVMHLSYLGALKTWLYAPLVLLPVWGPALIRVPTVLMGSVTILVFWALLERVHGRRAAWVGCALLATDTAFLLTTTFDWGPVALQHLLLVTAMYLAVRWFQGTSLGPLAGAAFCCGLAMWDKAVFMWVFAGILAGSLLFMSDLRRRLGWRPLATAAAAFTLGALPLIVYNLADTSRFASVRSNPQLRSDVTMRRFIEKLEILRATCDGSVLFGYLVNEDNAPAPKPAVSLMQRASFGLRRLAGEHRRNAMLPAFCGALILLPLLRRTRAWRAMLFCLVAIGVAWVFMALAGGGGSAHHAVLLWPLPHLFVAIAFAEASLRFRFGSPALAVSVGILVVSNLLVTNQYRYQFGRNGAAIFWTDAIYPLARALKQMQASEVFLPDWGMYDSLCVLNRCDPPTRYTSDPILAPTDPPAQRQADLQMLSDAKAVWVLHTSAYEAYKGINGRVLSAAEAAGFVPVMPQTYYDRNGRAIFQSFRFARK